VADRISPRLNPEFVEYAQSRGFVIDPARVRRPQDKGRVERAVQYAQGSFFAGEQFASLALAQRAAERWCRETAGQRVHGTTRQHPAEHFDRIERPALLAAPQQPYEIARWSEARVQRDHHVTAGKALYSVPTAFIGQRVRVRQGRELVHIYHRGQLIKSHPRQEPGQRSTDPADYPPGKRELACRDQQALLAQARGIGLSTGGFAERLLATPEPWQRMRQVYRLLGLARRYGSLPVEQACERALAADVLDITRIGRMVEQALEAAALHEVPTSKPATVLRFLRPKETYRRERGPGHE
jgi:hypothetical protein